MKIKEFIKSIRGLSDNTKLAYEQTLFLLHDTIAGDEPTDADTPGTQTPKKKPSEIVLPGLD